MCLLGFVCSASSMALAFSPTIPHPTRALRSCPLGLASSSSNPSHPFLFHRLPHTLRPRILRNSHGVSASASSTKTNATLSDVEQHQLQAADYGSPPTSTSTTCKICSNQPLWVLFLFSFFFNVLGFSYKRL